MTSVVATRQPTRQPRPRVDRCEYLASRGLTGIQPLKAIVGRAKKNGWDWINRIKLHGAVMNDHSVSLTYLFRQTAGDFMAGDNLVADPKDPHESLCGKKRALILKDAVHVALVQLHKKTHHHHHHHHH